HRGCGEVHVRGADLLAGDAEQHGILGARPSELLGEPDTEHAERSEFGVQVHRVAGNARALQVSRRESFARETRRDLPELLLILGEFERDTSHQLLPSRICRTSETASIPASVLPAQGMKLSDVHPASM